MGPKSNFRSLPQILKEGNLPAKNLQGSGMNFGTKRCWPYQLSITSHWEAFILDSNGLSFEDFYLLKVDVLALVDGGENL